VWVAIAAFVVGGITWLVLDNAHHTWSDQVTLEDIREMTEAMREGREWTPDEDQPWVVRNPIPTGIGAGVLTAIIGLLVVVALSLGQRGSSRTP
jgi:hypothetical protein